MLYLHDVWVNFFENVENTIMVPSYHEWKKDDGMMLLDQVPVLIVEESLYDYIANGMDEIPQVILEKMACKAFIRKGSRRDQLECAFVLTDGKESIVVNTEGYTKPVKKSKLMPQHDLIVMEMAEDCSAEYRSFKVQKTDRRDYSGYYGLTRSERELKNIFEVAVALLERDTIERLRYTVYELDNTHTYEELKEMDKDELSLLLTKSTEGKWSKKLEEYIPLLIKGHKALEEKYENHKNAVNK